MKKWLLFVFAMSVFSVGFANNPVNWDGIKDKLMTIAKSIPIQLAEDSDSPSEDMSGSDDNDTGNATEQDAPDNDSATDGDDSSASSDDSSTNSDDSSTNSDDE